MPLRSFEQSVITRYKHFSLSLLCGSDMQRINRFET